MSCALGRRSSGQHVLYESLRRIAIPSRTGWHRVSTQTAAGSAHSLPGCVSDTPWLCTSCPRSVGCQRLIRASWSRSTSVLSVFRRDFWSVAVRH